MFLVIIPVVNEVFKKRYNENEKATVVTMSKKVLDALTVKYSRVQEGVGKIMGGKILDYEAKDILNRGRAEVIRVMIKTARKYNVSDDEIIEQLVKELSILRRLLTI